MIQNNMLQAALQIAAKNLAVLPLAPGEKRPDGELAPNGCKDATTDEDQIGEWWTQRPNANIGIATDGLCVVDIDGADHPWLSSNQRLEALSGAPASQTPRGGRHYIFQQNGEPLRNTAGRLAPNVDTRADGGYIVAPPSIVNGKPYRWLEDLEPRDQLPTVPDWIVRELEIVNEGPVKLEGNTIAKGVQHMTLFKIGCNMRRMGLSCSEINAALQTINVQRCEEPGTEQAIQDIARSAAKYEPDQQAQADIECWDIQYPGLDSTDMEQTTAIDDPGPFPKSLLNVPGLIGSVMAYNLETAYKPQPVLALGAGIALMGVLTGRKIADPYGTRTNVYCLSVCKSGGGKENARKVNKKILAAAGATNLIGPEGVASHAGLFSVVEHQPSTLLQLDEIGRLLKTLSAQNAGAHLVNIITVLMKMFTSSDTVYLGDAYADMAKNKIIDQPHVCIYGTTVPQSLYEGFTAESITDGFLSRMLIFESDNHSPPRQRPSLKPIPDELVKTVRFWHQFGIYDELDIQHPKPKTVEYDNQAESVFDALETEAYEHQSKDNDTIASLWTRTNEKARKLALIYACSESAESPLVTRQAAEWACDLSRYLTRKIIHDASDWISENPFDAARKRVLRIIKDSKSKGISASGLCRKTQSLKKKERDEILHNLLSSGIVQQTNIGTKTKPKTVYVAR